MMGEIKTRFAIITATRAEYGLLYPLIKEMNKQDCFEIKLIVTGTHLSEYHGKTVKDIENDGVKADEILDLYIDGDHPIDINKYISRGISGFAEIYQRIKPDAIIVLGDRYELWAGCIPAVVSNIPIVHIHGGEKTKGAIDETIRHSITKMASFHFASILEYSKRIIQMGEQPEKVFTVGALGLDNILNTELSEQKELERELNISFNNNVAIMTFHPVTTDQFSLIESQVKEVMEAILESDLYTIVTMPNADVGGKRVYNQILEYLEQYPKRFRFIKSLGMVKYLSSLKYAKLMIGNSSSGIIESASFKIPVVNVGDRQDGRVKPVNVIDCECNRAQIKEAIAQALSESFIGTLSDLKNPYGDGKTAERIVCELKKIDFKDRGKLAKKDFYDIEFTI